MAKAKVIAVANQKSGVGKSTSVYCLGAGLAIAGKKVLLIDVDPQGDLTKMLGQRKPYDLPVTLGTILNKIVMGEDWHRHEGIMHHKEGFDFVPGNRTLSAVEMGLVNVMSREIVLKQYVKRLCGEGYDVIVARMRGNERMLSSFPAPDMAKAQRLINDFCESEFGHPADFQDPQNIGIACSAVTNAELEIQVNVNLTDFSIDRFVWWLTKWRRPKSF